ncbi:LOW QUALITY PROTEIN: uncharacterized protein T551_01477 [Pneumocystis jirovecii RU7]|uniref:Uncharacterized protein n=1 Tax=Pneumocystis jirovecii (strain RU7) TaxID=1408657 RepID=A0A0W4ZRB9_PNEJ7|nr:LOW QUALITY PROTEIN: uncharacterized protein T551_01477 [Pneumocystis jirovecii RU7]KTW30925.1 LOW QUALITY PROTEIN: hypothetical protein T551_01477 [Pneumocystis jirovecii RU7]
MELHKLDMECIHCLFVFVEWHYFNGMLKTTQNKKFIRTIFSLIDNSSLLALIMHNTKILLKLNQKIFFFYFITKNLNSSYFKLYIMDIDI